LHDTGIYQIKNIALYCVRTWCINYSLNAWEYRTQVNVALYGVIGRHATSRCQS